MVEIGTVTVSRGVRTTAVTVEKLAVAPSGVGMDLEPGKEQPLPPLEEVDPRTGGQSHVRSARSEDLVEETGMDRGVETGMDRGEETVMHLALVSVAFLGMAHHVPVSVAFPAMDHHAGIPATNVLHPALEITSGPMCARE